MLTGLVDDDLAFSRSFNLSVRFVEIRPSENQISVQSFYTAPSALGLKECKESVASDSGGNSTATANALVMDHDDGGGWYKVLEYKDAAYIPTTESVGQLSRGLRPSGFAKLADARIRALAKDRYYMRVSSASPLTKGSGGRHRVYLSLDQPYSDEGKAMGFAGHSYGLCVAQSLRDCEGRWHTGKQCGERFDTFCGVTGDDCSRWVADYAGAGASCGLGVHKGKRCFSTGQGCRSLMWKDVTVWVKPSSGQGQTLTERSAAFWLLGAGGKSCEGVCKEKGGTCSDDISADFDVAQMARAVSEATGVDCEEDQRKWWQGHGLPGFVTDPSDGNYKKCLGVKDIPKRVGCTERYATVRRWCRCIAAPPADSGSL